MAVGNYLGIKSERATELRRQYNEWDESKHAAKHGAITWLSFIAAGLLPLLPFILLLPVHVSFWISLAVTAAALFTVGALRTLVTERPPCSKQRACHRRPPHRRYQRCA